MTRRGQRFDAGHYYGIRADGAAVRLDVHDSCVVPDTVIARRVVDFPGGRVPDGGTVVPCVECGAPVVTNLQKFPQVQRRCMQCSHITPEPMP